MLITKADKEDFQKNIQEALRAPFSGWDFTYINKYGGKPEFTCPWNYEKKVRELIKKSNSLLDIGTGGGEFLSALKPFPKKVIATEAYKPNLKVAKDKLNPLGIEVVKVEAGIQESSPLPLDDNTFDLVIDRHECYESKEIYRILNSGGYFITQQGGNKDLERLVTIFGSLINTPEDFIWDLQNAVKYLDKAGLKIIEQRTHIANTRFYDIRVVVYFIKILEWLFPYFNVNLYKKRLENIYYLIKRDGFFEDVCHRFFIIAQKL